jgi:hypothetical protein
MMCISYFFSKLIRAPQVSFTWMLNHFVEGMPSENHILVHLFSSSSKFEIYNRQWFLHMMPEASDEGGGHGGASITVNTALCHQPRYDPQSPSLYIHIYGYNTRPCYMRSILLFWVANTHIICALCICGCSSNHMSCI